MNKYRPPGSCYFKLYFSDIPSNGQDAAFQEVSGINATLETVKVNEGGQNLYAHKLPGRMSYDDLVLKRGLMVWDSELAQWCWKLLQDGLRQTIEPNTVIVSLLDAQTRDPIMSWSFVNAYPIKWSVSNFNASQNAIAMETLTLTYSYFKAKADGAFYLDDGEAVANLFA